MNAQTLVNKLESWVQQELQAQRRLLELLGAQQEAIEARSGAGITQVGEEIQAHLRTGPARESRRLEHMSSFGRLWSVAAGTLTLRSIVERAAGDGLVADKLSRAREELRDVGAQVLRKGRRLAVLAKFHQGVLAEMLGILLSEGGVELPTCERQTGEGGVLVNQEA